MILINGECIDEMQKLIEEDVKVDLVLTDPPYGTVRCKWDNIIPFEPMWDKIHQLSKERTPTLLFGQEPFSSQLRLSNINEFKYDWIWAKTYGTNFLNANRTPLPSHEIISVFYKKLPNYNPQKKYVGKSKRKIRKGGKPRPQNVYGDLKKQSDYIDDGYRFPLSVIEYANNKGENAQSNRVHPTQKPVGLLEYLIKTYTNEEDLVLDFTMGSGSTGVACQNTNRNFIGIELDENYYNIAKRRINNCQTKLI